MPSTSPHPDTTGVIRTQVEASPHREHATSIYMTSSFTFEDGEHARALFAGERDGSIYSRYSNPNTDEFVQRMCVLESAEDGIAVASGMSSIFTTFAALLSAGDHIVSSRSVFGSTHQVLTQILPRWGITCTYAELANPASWEAALTPATKLCYVETPSNPALDLVDLEWLAGFCTAREITLVVDNIFATPILQKPIRLGADLVIHSATKYIDGQGRGIGGVIVGRADLIEPIRFFARHSGPSLSPFNAWLFSRSLETLDLRMHRHSASALSLAGWLEAHPAVAWVKYPFLDSHPQVELAKRQMKAGGGIVTFGVKGGLEAGQRVLDALQLSSRTANLGDSRTIVTHPASTTHSKLTEEARLAVGITPELLRLSVGLEAVEDIQADLEQALASVLP